MIIYRPTTDATDIYQPAASADYVRDGSASDPTSFAEAAKNAIVIQPNVTLPPTTIVMMPRQAT